MTDPVVAVVMSTYNGARHLPAMLASLAGQHRRPDRLVLRDDGSHDGSAALVAQWAEREAVALQRVAGPNLGAARSFLTAIAEAAPADITMLADQDDVWLPDKIARAVAHLAPFPASTPALYAARQHIVNENLSPIRDSPLPRHLSINSAVCENVLTGCTMAFNRSLADLLRQGIPARVPMHDWWIYLLAAATGTVLFDAQPTMLYRQHGENVIGAVPTGVAAGVARAKTLWRAPAQQRSDQLRALLHLHAGHLTPEARALVEMLARARISSRLRLRAGLGAPIVRQSPRDTATTRAMILLNRF